MRIRNTIRTAQIRKIVKKVENVLSRHNWWSVISYLRIPFWRLTYSAISLSVVESSVVESCRWEKQLYLVSKIQYSDYFPVFSLGSVWHCQSCPIQSLSLIGDSDKHQSTFSLLCEDFQVYSGPYWSHFLYPNDLIRGRFRYQNYWSGLWPICIDFGLVTADPSGKFCPCPLFDMDLEFLEKSETKWLKWLRGNVSPVMMFFKRSELFHSSSEKLPFARISVSWFLVSTYLIGILGSKLIRSKIKSRVILWVLDTCPMKGLLSLSLSSW